MQVQNISGVKQLVYLCLFAILSTDLSVHGQSVDLYPSPKVTVSEGNITELLCRASNSLTYCRFEIPGLENAIRVSDKSNKGPFQYYGEGLQKGDCGITIPRVTLQNDGKVKCTLGLEQDELVGVFELFVALPPNRPEIHINNPSRDNVYQIDDEIQASCISKAGRPAAELKWFLNDEPITEGVSAPIVTDEITNSSLTLYTTIIRLQRRMKASDDHKYLRCQSIHPADAMQQDQHQLQVRYRPLPRQDIRVYGLPLGQTVLVNVTIEANPRPRTVWVIDGVSIEEATQHDHYEARIPQDLGNGSFNVILAIADLTVEDTFKVYHLKAQNEFGLSEYEVMLSAKINTTTQN